MPWGTVDDGMDEHPKVEELLDSDDPILALAAMGLWQLAFTWAHRNTRRRGKTPGLIPAATLRRWVPRSHRDEIVGLLVKVRLWDEHPDGWMIHDFADYLPSEKTRAERSAAGKKGAAARWGKTQAADGIDKASSHDVIATDGNLPSNDGNEPSNDGNGYGKDGSRAHPLPVPSTQTLRAEDQNHLVNAARRPGPDVLPGTEQALIPIDDMHSASVQRVSRDTQFAAYWGPYPRKVGKQGARKVWDTKVRNGADPDAIAAGAVAFAEHVRAWQTPEDKIPHPSTWLNRGSWEDRLPAPPSTAVTLRDDRPQSATLPDGRNLGRKATAHLDHAARYGDLDD